MALVLPEVSTAAMDRFLAELGAAVPPGAHAVLVLDRAAGWHTSRGAAAPPNLTPAHLPPYSPELTPVGKLWRSLRFLSHRVPGDLDAVVDAACAAWNRRVAEPGRVASLTRFPWPPPSVSTS